MVTCPRLSTFVCLLRYKSADSKKKKEEKKDGHVILTHHHRGKFGHTQGVLKQKLIPMAEFKITGSTVLDWENPGYSDIALSVVSVGSRDHQQRLIFFFSFFFFVASPDSILLSYSSKWPFTMQNLPPSPRRLGGKV